jgi:hypothetical protein
MMSRYAFVSASRRRLGHVALALLLAGPASLAASQLPAFALANCSGGAGQHWYAVANSGAGSTTGTRADTQTWTNWSVTNNGVSFSDEAVWIATQGSNNTTSIEGGFYSGAGNNVAWTNGMLPYDTVSNGNNEYDAAGQYLPATTNIRMYVETSLNGVSAKVVVYNTTLTNMGNYVVGTNRENFMQGEIANNTGVWMGGGSGEGFQMYWQSLTGYPNGAWYTWGFMNNCADSPYWYTKNTNSNWNNGGY